MHDLQVVGSDELQVKQTGLQAGHVLVAELKYVFDEQVDTHSYFDQSRMLSTKKLQHDQQLVALNSQS